jgi:ATP-dependent Clp protease ATP-binding subunit ClpC
MELTEKAKDFLAEKGYDQQYGARPLNRAIQKFVEDPLAEEILKGTMSEGDVIMVDHEENGESLKFSKKPKEETIEQ